MGKLGSHPGQSPGLVAVKVARAERPEGRVPGKLPEVSKRGPVNAGRPGCERGPHVPLHLLEEVLQG